MPRQIHLIDVDNLTGGPTRDTTVHSEIREWYDIHSDRCRNDLCFVAASHYSALSASKAWEGARILWASGLDGADNALIKIIDEVNFLNIRRVCLGSGDWIFKFALSDFSRRGIEVAVCCRENSLSKELKTLTDNVTYISTYSDKNFNF